MISVTYAWLFQITDSSLQLAVEVFIGLQMTNHWPYPPHKTRSSDQPHPNAQVRHGPVITAELCPVIRKMHINPLNGRPLSQPVEDGDPAVTAVYYGDELIGIERGDTRHQMYGIALDVGTAVLTATLIDLNSGEELATETRNNPQPARGPDAPSRMHLAKDPATLRTLHHALIDCIQQMINRLCAHADVPCTRIYEIMVAANTSMLHLLLNVRPPSQSGLPHTPALSAAQRVQANRLNLAVSPYAQLTTLPAASTNIGSNIVAGALTACLENQSNTLFIDIGANSVMILAHQGELSACSCMVIPARERASFSMGASAVPGAVEQVSIRQDGMVCIQTIDNAPAAGLCASGVVSAVAEMVRTRQICKDGQIIADSPLASGCEATREIVLCVEPRRICISQDDIRRVRLTKGAMLSSILTLLDQHGLQPDDLDELLIAGQFGEQLTPDTLVNAGMIPAVLKDRIFYLGNTSKTGASRCLLSTVERDRAQALSTLIQEHEPVQSEEFNRLFVSCLDFY